jgi:hypothetical protein
MHRLLAKGPQALSEAELRELSSSLGKGLEQVESNSVDQRLLVESKSTRVSSLQQLLVFAFICIGSVVGMIVYEKFGAPMWVWVVHAAVFLLIGIKFT